MKFLLFCLSTFTHLYLFSEVLHKHTIKEKLCLSPIGTETVLIETFGNNEASLKKCDIVQFALECKDDLTEFINGYEVDLICGPITNQVIEVAQQYYPHMQGLPLADYSRGDEELVVDIMIGAGLLLVSRLKQHCTGGSSMIP